jgi:hypothetical protein
MAALEVGAVEEEEAETRPTRHESFERRVPSTTTTTMEAMGFPQQQKVAGTNSRHQTWALYDPTTPSQLQAAAAPTFLLLPETLLVVVGECSTHINNNSKEEETFFSSTSQPLNHHNFNSNKCCSSTVAINSNNKVST